MSEHGQLTDIQALGDRVRIAREQMGMSQGELAKQMARQGHSAWRQTTVSRTERGTRRLVVDELRTLEQLLSCDLYQWELLVPNFAGFMLERMGEDLDSAKASGEPDLLRRANVEFESKARILARHSPLPSVHFRGAFSNPDQEVRHGLACSVCNSKDDQWYPCLTLRLLAIPYADHAECRPEWIPEAADAIFVPLQVRR